MALGRIADAVCPLVEHVAKHDAPVVGCSPNEEVARGWPPGVGQPVDIALEPARGQHQRLAFDVRRLPANGDVEPFEPTIRHGYMRHLRLVENRHPQILGGVVVGVDQRFATTEEKGVGA